MKTNTARAEKLLLCTFLQIKEELGHGETSSRIWMLQRAKSLRICSFPDVYIHDHDANANAARSVTRT